MPPSQGRIHSGIAGSREQWIVGSLLESDADLLRADLDSLGVTVVAGTGQSNPIVRCRQKRSSPSLLWQAVDIMVNLARAILGKRGQDFRRNVLHGLQNHIPNWRLRGIAASGRRNSLSGFRRFLDRRHLLRVTRLVHRNVPYCHFLLPYRAFSILFCHCSLSHCQTIFFESTTSGRRRDRFRPFQAIT